jgi:hypothetical protein
MIIDYIIKLKKIPDAEPLAWSTMATIAIDSAWGLEYTREHTVDAYIQSDIKAEYVLLDKTYNCYWFSLRFWIHSWTYCAGIQSWNIQITFLIM